VTLPLLIPQSLAQHLRSGDWSDNADSSDALAERAESLADRAEARADSAAEQGQRRAMAITRSKLGDSLRAEGKRRADSVHKALGRMADSLKAR
jgi:hypothetical protein